GLNNNICQIYKFISNNYKTEDKLFFFSFLYRAFTIYTVASLICNAGVILVVYILQFAEI
ncbi:hypothetical protein EDB80DRAFT_563338, partial [Ilyonectria destructans]